MGYAIGAKLQMKSVSLRVAEQARTKPCIGLNKFCNECSTGASHRVIDVAAITIALGGLKLSGTTSTFLHYTGQGLLYVREHGDPVLDGLVGEVAAAAVVVFYGHFA